MKILAFSNTSFNTLGHTRIQNRQETCKPGKTAPFMGADRISNKGNHVVRPTEPRNNFTRSQVVMAESVQQS